MVIEHFNQIVAQKLLNMYQSKTSIRLFLLVACTCFLLSTSLQAQKTAETSQDLSKAARKGMLTNAELTDDGNIRLTYKMKIDKKSDEVTYEDYVFDTNLGFKGIQPSKINKTMQPNQTITTLAAYVGGSNSFNVMSMTLKLQKENWERLWDLEKQTYKWGKRLSKEEVKPRNSESKYKGFASFPNDDEGSVTVLASYDQDKDDNDQFVLLYVTNDLNVKETKLPLTGSYSLVYCDSKKNGNIFAIFAPNKGMSDTKKYAYTEFTAKGDAVSNFVFDAPSPNTIIIGHREESGALYFVGGSTKSNDAYNQEFSSYAPISNPGYSTSANKQMDKYEKKLYGAEFANLHFLKIANSKLDFASTTLIKDFKSKLVTPPSQKKGQPYEGKKFAITNVAVTPNGEYLVTGQLDGKKIVNGGNDIEYRYYDFVCLHFAKNGDLKAQYAVDKIYDDSKSEVFFSPQSFIFSPDGNTAYWQILEVKGAKGYSSFIDAFFGNTTFTAHYFPRIAKIDLNAGKVSDFTVFGNKGKFLLYRYNNAVMDQKTKTFYYVGHDEDYEKVWVGKYQLD
jgi:hypothetical protein